MKTWQPQTKCFTKLIKFTSNTWVIEPAMIRLEYTNCRPDNGRKSSRHHPRRIPGLYRRLISILREVRGNSEIPTQKLIDDVYSLMVSLILNKNQRNLNRRHQKGNIKRKIQCYTYGPKPSGRTKTKTATDLCRGQILNHRNHNLKKLRTQRQLQLKQQKLEQDHQRQHEHHQNLVLEQQQLIVNQFFNVVTNLDGGEAENSNTSSVQHNAEGKSSHNTTVLPSSTLHYRTESSESETVLGTGPKIKKLHDDEVGTSAEKTKTEHKEQEKKKIVFLNFDLKSHK